MAFSSFPRNFEFSFDVTVSLLYLSILSIRILDWLFLLAMEGISVKPGIDKGGHKSPEIASVIILLR